MTDIATKVIDHTDPEYAAVCRLRDEVLRKPLGLSLKNEDLSADKEDLIVIALQKNEVVGCVMLHPKSNEVVKLRQMAVQENLQGRGIGRMLIDAAEVAATQAGYETIELHARYKAIPFYEKLLYLKRGDIFTEVGIPHVLMYKIIPH